MALIINSTNSIFDPISVALAPSPADTDLIKIEATGYLHGYGQSAHGIFLYDVNTTDFLATSWNIVVEGSVSGIGPNSAGILVASNGDSAFANIDVNAGGSVVGNTGIHVHGGAIIENSGLIRGLTGPAIKFEFSAFTVNNLAGGFIDVGTNPFAIQIGNGGTTTINNAGTIRGTYAVYGQGSSTAKINNDGFLNGYVALGSGNDIIDTRDGRIAKTSFLGSGSDRYLGSNVYADIVTGQGDADTLLGFAGNDTLYGEAGNDILDGGRGRDRLEGGSQNDTFIYRSVLDLGATTTTRDTIVGFDAAGLGNDILDLRVIDAIAGGVDNVFIYRGTAAFTGLGQIRVVASGADTIVQLNTTGSLAADSTIFLQGTSIASMGIDDFLR